jgi:hypothetical protein
MATLSTIREQHYFAAVLLLLAFPVAYVVLRSRAGPAPIMGSLSLLSVPELICVSILLLVYLRRPFALWTGPKTIFRECDLRGRERGLTGETSA